MRFSDVWKEVGSRVAPKMAAAGLMIDPSTLLEAIGDMEVNELTKPSDIAFDAMRNNMRNPTPAFRSLLEKAEREMQERDKIKVDSTSFDYASLASSIVPGSIWMISINKGVVVDPAKPNVMLDPSRAHAVPGAIQKFDVICSTFDAIGLRSADTYDGLPTSKDILLFIQRCFSLPIPPLRPAVPEMLIIEGPLKPHEEALKPFLNTIPSPFLWFVEWPELVDVRVNAKYAGSQMRVKKYQTTALEFKVKGNDAFNRKDRSAALEAYEKALYWLEKALLDAIAENDEKSSRNLMAICYANRSATHLIKGEGVKPESALEDAERAIHADPSYAKGYYRLSQAHEVLDNVSKAQEVVIEAMRLPALKNDRILASYMIMLQTDGKGLPDSKPQFDTWLEKVSHTMDGIDGEWRRLVDLKASGFN